MMKAVIAAAFACALALAALPVVVAVGAAGTAAVTLPEGSSRGAIALSWALEQVGKPYVWGAAGPGAFDCSGLAMRAWAAAGVNLPRVAAEQYGAGAHVPVADAAPGDLVFFAADPAQPSTIEHVGISLGDGRMVDAPHT